MKVNKIRDGCVKENRDGCAVIHRDKKYYMC